MDPGLGVVVPRLFLDVFGIFLLILLLLET